MGSPAPPPLAGVAPWVNSEPLSLDALRGSVVLLHFFSYARAECLRTLPRVRSMWGRWRDAGFVVLGVHAPEWTFERDPANVRRAVQDLLLTYPVALDDAGVLLRAYGGGPLPRAVLLGPDGRIVLDHAGEAGYDRIEEAVKQMLAGAREPRLPPVPEPDEGLLLDLAVMTPETRCGPGRDAARVVLSGPWTEEAECVRYAGPPHGGAMTLRFLAGEANAVLGPPAGSAVEVEVLLDGAPLPRGRRGADVLEKGGATVLLVDRPRLHRIYRAPSFDAHEILLRPRGPGLAAYAWSFAPAPVVRVGGEDE